MNKNEFVGMCACVAVASALYFSTQTSQQSVPDFTFDKAIAGL